MNYLSPGLREISRKCRRLIKTVRRSIERRRLTRAETELGLLGWQQADYDPVTERQVQNIQNYEREQARLTNEGAELGRAIRACMECRQAARKEFDEIRSQVETERKAAADATDSLEKQVVALRRQEPTYEKRIPELDRELREVTELYGELLTSEKQSPKLREELIRLRERTVAIPNEKADLRTQHLRVVSELKSLETQLARHRQHLGELERKLQALEDAFYARDREIAAEIKQREKEKAKVDREINALEAAKENPYLEIGRVLADNNLAPMNQPDALEKVRTQRFIVHELDYDIMKSLQASENENRDLVRISYIVWMAVSFTALVIVVALRG